MKWTKKEKILLRELQKIKLSPTHNLDHAKNTCQYAVVLAKKHGGRREIIIPACLLHDSGRSNPNLHGQDSSQESVRLAKPLLKKAGHTSKEIILICQAISEHDQPNFSSSLLESRILKDADFLDGFGVQGILRIIYYTAEAGQPLDKALYRLQVTMKKRYEGLEFEESKKMAEEEFLLVQLVLSYSYSSSDPAQRGSREANYKESSRQARTIKKCTYSGKYIVFEGISGTGKETQAKLLKKYLEKKGKKVEIIFHPTVRLKQVLKDWRKKSISLMTEAFLFIGDRHDMVEKKLLPALKKGKWVISLRNRVSCMVYQAKTEREERLINYLFSTFEPKPDLIFYFDLAPKEALKRIKRRIEETGEEKGAFEKIDLLTKKRKHYKKVLGKFHDVFTIDASGKVDETQKEIQRIVDSLFFKSFKRERKF